ncbi:START domain-containing protein [Carboxylicivirga marina]|uniref:START domain-containing protein n=1 Tax=Carboxylicivirga marina TaxID=2800988 RepID=UPI0025966E72|nr:START domain-containing protein [uncultured Carboxylicivirga sp.]
MIFLAILLVKFLFPDFTTVKLTDLLLHPTKENEWTCVKSNKGIQLYERWVQINDTLFVRERKGELITNCSLKKTEDYLRDHSTVCDWMKGIKSVQSISTDSGQLVHMVIQLPWPFSNRDLLARYHFYKIDGKTSVVQVKSDKTVTMPDNRFIRIKHYVATWRLEQINEQQTKIVFETFSNEAPIFPQWIQEPVLKKIFMSNLKRLKSRLSDSQTQ